MTEQYYPAGWDEARVKKLTDHTENMSDEEWLAEDEAARVAEGQTTATILTDLVSHVQQMIAR